MLVPRIGYITHGNEERTSKVCEKCVCVYILCGCVSQTTIVCHFFSHTHHLYSSWALLYVSSLLYSCVSFYITSYCRVYSSHLYVDHINISSKLKYFTEKGQKGAKKINSKRANANFHFLLAISLQWDHSNKLLNKLHVNNRDLFICSFVCWTVL